VTPARPTADDVLRVGGRDRSGLERRPGFRGRGEDRPHARFVKTNNRTAVLGPGGPDQGRGVGGPEGYVTNIPATLMPSGEVIASHHDLWDRAG
jgi:hypothetical protein